VPRAMSGAMLTALTASHLRPAILVAAEFATETLYLWSGVGPITWNSHTWTGVGAFGGISLIEEGATVEARGITLTLSGIDPQTLADALQEIEIGRPVTVYIGLFDASSALIVDPLTSWKGKIDQPTIDVSGTSATISINCESKLLNLNVDCSRRYTMEDQQIEHPGDLGMMFQTAIQECTLYWGTSPNSSNNI